MALRLTILILFLFGLSATEKSYSQVRKFSFQQLGEAQGVPQNFVYGLTQDVRGFLWIGTGIGLSRYDGYEIKNYTASDSLSADFVTADFRTASGNLVFGHNQGGITLFDGVAFHPLLPDTLGSKVVSISEDRSHNLWIATQSKGFVVIDITGHRVSTVFPVVLQEQIINVTFSRRGILWVGTNEGLFLFRINGNSLVQLENDVLPAYVGVTSILPHDTDSTLCWLGTAFQGIYLLQQGSEDQIAQKERLMLPELSEDVVHAIAQDADGDLWVGTGHNGVLYLNIGRDRKTVFQINYFRKSSGFPFTAVNKLIVDQHGQIWVGTMGDGLIKIYKEIFTYFPFATRFGVSEVRSIAETVLGYLVATDNGLVQITLNHQSDEYEVGLLDILRDESILSVYTDREKNTWIGTEMKGVFILRGEKNTVQHVPIDPENGPVEVRLFEEDKDGNMWMSARGKGIYALNKEKKVIKHLTTTNHFIHNDIFAIKADSRGNIWFGAYGTGLAMLGKDQVVQLFSNDSTLRSRDINDIDEDDAGNIWIATEGEGFYRYSDKKFTHVGSVESIMPPFIKGIKFDPTGRIWFSHRKGLGFYDLQSQKKYHFAKEDGLLASETYSSSIIVDSRSNKWFCNDYGVTLFENDTITDKRSQLETYLTGIRIFFKNYPAKLQNQELERSMVGALPPLELTHKENHITFDFVAIKLNGNGKIYYRHFLEGYDSEWTPAETANFVTYTNLDPGKYILKVQATDDLGAWVDPVTEYSFVITPPFWKRTWFYLLQILSVITLFFLTYFIGKKGIATKRYVLRLMLFSCFFITLEYVENFIDPLVSGFFDGVPVFRFFLNFLLALLLLPVETLITHWLMDDEKKLQDSKSPQALVISKGVLENEMIESPKG
jgi:ligand-binding sensor domain-containing protein